MAQNVNKSNAVYFCRYRVTMSAGHFQTFDTKPSGWFHVVLNVIGPDNGIRIYHDGIEVASDTTTHGDPKHNGDRRIVIGRYHAKSEGTYSSLQVDELLFFNQMLTDDEITMLSQLST